VALPDGYFGSAEGLEEGSEEEVGLGSPDRPLCAHEFEPEGNTIRRKKKMMAKVDVVDLSGKKWAR